MELYIDEINYFYFDKCGNEYKIEYYEKILNTYDIKLPSKRLKKIDEDDYVDKISDLAQPLIERMIDETFTLLFNDKIFLMKFNYEIKMILSKMKKKDYPDILTSDGIIKRCDHIPTWLKKGVFYRDKGKCQKCYKDLTGTIALDQNIHYDHIIPLHSGGTNDPTNFQLLCDKCNLKKSYKYVKPSTKNLTFW